MRLRSCYSCWQKKTVTYFGQKTTKPDFSKCTHLKRVLHICWMIARQDIDWTGQRIDLSRREYVTAVHLMAVPNSFRGLCSHRDIMVTVFIGCNDVCIGSLWSLKNLSIGINIKVSIIVALSVLPQSLFCMCWTPNWHWSSSDKFRHWDTHIPNWHFAVRVAFRLRISQKQFLSSWTGCPVLELGAPISTVPIWDVSVPVPELGPKSVLVPELGQCRFEAQHM